MRDVKIRFRNLVNNLKYGQIRLDTHNINMGKLIPWMRLNMPLVIQQLEPLGWDLSDDKTWLETMFITEVLKWYGNKVAVFITDSFLDYQLSTTLFTSPIMKKFWEMFDIQAHISVLVDTTMFIKSDNLDDIYIALDWKKRYSLLDLSGYDEDDNILPHLIEDWGFLESTLGEHGEYASWSDLNKIQAHIKNT